MGEEAQPSTCDNGGFGIYLLALLGEIGDFICFVCQFLLGGGDWFDDHPAGPLLTDFGGARHLAMACGTSVTLCILLRSLPGCMQRARERESERARERESERSMRRQVFEEGLCVLTSVSVCSR